MTETRLRTAEPGDASFGALLRRARVAAVLTQERLAERARISSTGIAALESGRRRAPRATTVALLLDALDLDEPARIELIAAAAGERERSDSSPGVGRPGRSVIPDAPTAADRSEFLGRAAEARLLVDATAEHARVIMVAGEAGIGKTRLVREFIGTMEGRRLLWGQCTPHRLGSYEPFVGPIRSAVALLPGAAVRVGQLARLIPELDLSGVDRATSADHEVERRLLFDAAASLLQDLGPTVLVLDDLHWADSSSLALLAFLAAHPLLEDLTIVVTVRTTDLGGATASALADLRRRTKMRRIELRGLAADAVAELVQVIAGSDTTERLLSAVAVAADGNPLFVRELTEHLVTSGYGVDGTEAVVPERIPAPVGIRETLLERLGTVGDDAQRIVRTGAVLGRSFDPDLAADIAGVPRDRVLAATEDALLSGLVTEVSATEIVFTHGLVQSAVYDSLSARRRLDIHRRAALLLERRSGQATDSWTFDLARHWAAVAAEDPSASAAAAIWAHRAGDAASAAADIDRAIDQYERAARLWVEPTRDHVETLLSLGSVLSSLSRRDEADARFRAALGLAEAIGDGSLVARAAIGLAFTVRYGVVEPERVALLEKALSGLGPDDFVLRTMTAAMLKRQLGFDSSDAAYRRRQEAAAIVLDAVSRPELERELLLTLGTARDAIMVDDPQVLARLSRATIAIGEAERRLHVSAHGWYGQAWAALELADGHAWQEAVESFSTVAAELDLPFEQAVARTMAATTALIEGRYADAERLAAEAHAIGAGADPNADTTFLAATVIAGVDLGRGAAMVEMMRANHDELVGVPTFLAGFAATAALSGATELARELLDQHIETGLHAVRRDLEWLPVMGFLASTASRVGTPHVGRELYELLSEHPAAAVRVGAIAGWWGPTDHHLGGLCRRMGRVDEAERRLRRALRTSHSMRARPWRARSQLELAELLERRPGSAGEVSDLRAEAEATAAELGAPGLLE